MDSDAHVGPGNNDIIDPSIPYCRLFLGAGLSQDAVSYLQYLDYSEEVPPPEDLLLNYLEERILGWEDDELSPEDETCNFCTANIEILNSMSIDELARFLMKNGFTREASEKYAAHAKSKWAEESENDIAQFLVDMICASATNSVTKPKVEKRTPPE
jgi:hypothetical protein